MSRSWTRWVPAGAAAAVVAGLAVGTQPAVAGDLPERTPQEVLALVAEREVEAFSGSFELTADLGLPEVPASLGGEAEGLAGAAELLAVLTGTHSGRLFVGGPGTVRLQLMETFAQRDVVVDGTEVWSYDSAENTATRVALPDPRGPGTAFGPPGADHRLPTPDGLAERLLEAADPSTEISVDQVSVAGHAAYELVLTPRTEDTLVASVAVAVEGETGLPLRVTVRARGQEEPVVQAGFTSLDLSAPDPDLFDFVPPPDATVVEQELPAHDGPRGPVGEDGAQSPFGHDGPGGPVGDDPPRRPSDGRHAMPEHIGPDALRGVDRPVVHGSGWDAVVAVPAGPGAALPPELTQPVDGGRLLSTALVNVLVTEDGTMLLGAVPVERLQAVAGA